MVGIIDRVWFNKRIGQLVSEQIGGIELVGTMRGTFRDRVLIDLFSDIRHRYSEENNYQLLISLKKEYVELTKMWLEENGYNANTFEPI